MKLRHALDGISTVFELTNASKRRECYILSRRMLQRGGFAPLDFCGNARRHGEANRRKFYARLREYASRRLYTPGRTRARYH